MSSMTSPGGSVIGGVDAHTDTHDAAALDERGRLLGTRTFPSTPEGNRALLAWLESFGSIAVIGVESTGSYAAGLVRFLRSREVAVVEINQPHAHTRRRRGKSDPIDAAVGFHVLRARLLRSLLSCSFFRQHSEPWGLLRYCVAVRSGGLTRRARSFSRA
jgi:transposase